MLVGRYRQKFWILNHSLKLHLKESLLIKHDKPELNRNIYNFPLQLFNWLYSLIWVKYSCNFHFNEIVNLIAIHCNLKMLLIKKRKSIFRLIKTKMSVFNFCFFLQSSRALNLPGSGISAQIAESIPEELLIFILPHIVNK